MTFYGMGVCPYVGSLDGVVLFGVFALASVATLFLTVPRLEAALQARFRSWPMVVFIPVMSAWVLCGLVIALFNHLAFGFPVASGIKVLVGFIAIGLFSAIDTFLDCAHKRINNAAEDMSVPDDNSLSHPRFFPLANQFLAFVLLVTLVMGVSLLLLLKNDLALHQAEYAVNPDLIYRSILTHVLFILAVIGVAAYYLGAKYRRNFKLMVELQIQQLNRILQGDYRTHLPVLSQDEFGLFAMRINRIVDNLAMNSQQLAQLKEESLRDPLTGVYNRAYLQNYIDDMAAKPSRRTRSLGVLLLDIDYFKRINDTHGHVAGDAVLQDVAKVLNEHLREHDKVVRYGGEEFLVLLEDAREGVVYEMAERLRYAVAHTPMHYEDIVMTVSISVGAVLAQVVEHDLRLEDIIDNADQALYRAKHAGRNRVEFNLWSDPRKAS